MRKPLVVANWKMNKTIEEALVYVGALLADVSGEITITDSIPPATWPEVVIAPPAPALAAVSAALAGTGLLSAAQNIHWERKGAFTGEISGEMVKAAGATYVIIGHSERRSAWGETDEMVAKKTRAALDQGLFPIVCVGETLEEREAGATGDIVSHQVRKGLALVSPHEADRLVIAYEPVWAIGTGREARVRDAEDVSLLIRNSLDEMMGRGAGSTVRVLYGGSVTPENVGGFMACRSIDGTLVGGKSLDPAAFSGIIRETLRRKSRKDNGGAGFVEKTGGFDRA